jgi:hypothetical protein
MEPADHHHRLDPAAVRTEAHVTPHIEGGNYEGNQDLRDRWSARRRDLRQRSRRRCSTTPILGCVKPGTGLLRIPPSSEGCMAQETPLGFNDLPLLVALRAQVEQLQDAVAILAEMLARLEACTASIPGCNPE